MGSLEKLKNKKIIFGISGSISAYKACDIVNILTKNGANVHCILTDSAKEFITKKTLESLTKNPVIDDMFLEIADVNVRHISLTANNDLFIVAPATANIISKFA
ncbi:MAG: bifunctional 4'-phosphopantothenoylcysteine decarboxylase/phosphopantothenoylcysteine synthetase, partial [Elusimicrobiota bacterium]|nr:bifunctional 4'-phosphopantothenoylcysteine decarboxylase/phosphopantothenoylcysteine synthetase [Elusimicrobiota bacterium]